MQLSAYWISTFFGDLFKFSITITINIAVFIAFKLEFDLYWVTLLVYPFGVLPFTYVSSFIFQSTSVAQTLTLFFNFVSLLILPMLVYFMRMYEELEKEGDMLNQIFKTNPSYCLAASLYFDNAGAKLYQTRENS